MKPPGLLVVLGASGAGKTAAVHTLEARSLPGVQCHYFDSVGIPSAGVMERQFGGLDRWQADATERWLARLLANRDGAAVAVLEGQTRPSFVRAALAEVDPVAVRILLLDCSPPVRHQRLQGPRGQPELATQRMDGWAAYLRGQADALSLPVIDTTHLTIDAVADALTVHIEALRREVEAAL